MPNKKPQSQPASCAHRVAAARVNMCIIMFAGALARMWRPLVPYAEKQHINWVSSAPPAAYACGTRVRQAARAVCVRTLQWMHIQHVVYFSMPDYGRLSLCVECVKLKPFEPVNWHWYWARMERIDCMLTVLSCLRGYINGIMIMKTHSYMVRI